MDSRMESSMKRRGFCILSLAIVGFVFVSSDSGAHADTFSVELSDITTDAHPAANYLQAHFDLGTSFRSIESVSLQLTMPNGYGSSSGTPEVYTQSYLRILLHQAGFDLSPRLPESELYAIPPPLRLSDTQFAYQDYQQLRPNVPKTIEFHPYINGCWPGCMIAPGHIFEYYRPAFLYSGKGQVTLQASVFQSSFFGPDGGIDETTIYTKPPAVTEATLVIEGTPTPETTSIGLLLVGLGLIAGRRQPRTGMKKKGRH